MLSKTDEFNINIILVSSIILHNKIKEQNFKTMLKLKFKKISKLWKIPIEELEYAFIYLQRQGIIYSKDAYLLINIELVKNLIKKYFKENSVKNSIIIQPNFEIIVKPEVALKDLFYIIQFSILEEKDVIYKFKITSDSLHIAFNLNWTNKKIINFLSTLTENKIPENVKFFIDEIYKRTGEIVLGVAGNFISGKKFLIKQIEKNNEISQFILKELRFYPKIELKNVEMHKDKYYIKVSNDELLNIYSALLTLREIGFEHKISVDYNSLNHILSEIENILTNTEQSKAIDKSIKYQQELKNSIKHYILKTLRAHIDVPNLIVSNKISSQYTEANPAFTLKDMKSIINFAIKHKVFIIIKLKSCDKEKSKEYMVEPRYLYKNKLYAYVRELKEEQSFDLKKLSYIMLPV